MSIWNIGNKKIRQKAKGGSEHEELETFPFMYEAVEEKEHGMKKQG